MCEITHITFVPSKWEANSGNFRLTSHQGFRKQMLKTKQDRKIAFSFKGVPKRLYPSLGKKGDLGRGEGDSHSSADAWIFWWALALQKLVLWVHYIMSLCAVLDLPRCPSLVLWPWPTVTLRGLCPARGGISHSSPDSNPPSCWAAPNDILNSSQRWIIKTAAIGPRRACRGGLFQNNEYGNSASVMNCKQSSNSLVPKIHTCLSHNLSLFFYYYCSICKQGQETLCSFVPPYICPLIPVSLPSPQHRQDYTKQKSLIFISDYLWAF